MENWHVELFLQRDARHCDKAPVTLDDWDPRAVPTPVRRTPPTVHARHSEPSDSSDFPPEGLSELLDQWPGGRARVFGRLGIKGIEVDQWLKGGADFRPEATSALYKLLRVELSQHGDWELAGGYLICARGARKFCSLYDALSHGGDLRFSHELVGPDGETLDVRVLVFANYRNLANFAFFDRQQREQDLLDSTRRLINLGAPLRAPRALWEDIQVVVRALEKNLQHVESIGALLESRHQDWFDSLERW